MGLIEYETMSRDALDVGELRAFYQGQSHPTTDSDDKLRLMVERSDCFVMAREDGRLIGLARGMSDGVRGWLAECKLEPGHQGPAAVTRTDGRIEHDDRCIARELAMRVLERLRDEGVEEIHVTAHGTEEDFCFDLGFRKMRGVVAMQMDAKSLSQTSSVACAGGQVL